MVITAAILTDEATSGARCSRRCASSARRSTRSPRCRPAALARLTWIPEGPTPASADHTLLDSLPAEAIDALVDAAPVGQPESPLLVAELRHLGGALGRLAEGRGRAPKVDGAYLGVRRRGPDGPGRRRG